MTYAQNVMDDIGRHRGDVMKNGLEPKILICNECNEEFVFTVAAQEYFLERGYSEDPKRCKTCHTQYKKSQRNNGHRRSEERSFVVDYPE